MDDPALRLMKAQHEIAAERAMRSKAEHELRIARLELTRAKRIIVGLQRQAVKREEAGAGS
jgi:hypothetical protein